MTIPQADGTTAATLRGPGLRSTPQTAALRGPASGANRRKRRRKPNTRRRPKNINAARRRAPRTNLKSCQRVKGRCLQRESPKDPVLHPAPLQISTIRQLGGDGGPRHLSETRGPTLDPTHPVSPDLEEDPGLIQDPEVFLGLEVALDPDLSPILDPALDPGQDQDPSTDLGLYPERGVHPDPQEKGKPVSPKWTP